jgi:hypothetical protein
MDTFGGYHPEWDNLITKEHTWCALTDKRILGQKLRILKIQFENTWNSRRRKTKVWILSSFLECGTKYPWKELQRQCSELRWKERPFRDCPACDPFHIQPPNPETIEYVRKILLTGPWHSSLLWVYTNAWQAQKWMLTVIYWLEHRAPNEGDRESSQGAKGVCSPIRGTTIWTNQYSQSSCF